MGLLNLNILKKAVQSGRIEWRRHALEKMLQRGITRNTVLSVLLDGEKIRDYLEDRPFPSALFLGFQDSRPIHVLTSCDQEKEIAYVITAYEPSPEQFENDWKTRRRP